MKDGDSSESYDVIQQALFEGYYERKVLPRPTLSELYSDYDIIHDKKLAIANKIMLDRFKISLRDTLAMVKRKKNPLPSMAIAYVVPLPFYLPIQELFHAVSFFFDNPESGCYVSFFSKTFGKYNAKVRLSYALISICNAASFMAYGGDGQSVSNNYDIAIEELNKIIRSFKSLPNRHNHYVYEVTRNKLPASIPYYYFNYNNGEMFDGGMMAAHFLPAYDILQNEYLSDEELNELKVLHFNSSFSDNNVIKLLVLLNSAIDAHCCGDDTRALLNISLFVEYSLGFLYMEARHIKEPSLPLEKVAEAYVKKSKDKKFSPINAIASIVGKSDEGYIEGFKVKTGFEDFAAKYKDMRNHQMHDFFSGMVSESDSRGAIECGAKLVCSVAKEVMRKATDEASIGQLSRLIEATNKCLRY